MMPRRNPELTARIVRKASIGETKKQIAEDLGITQKTVKRHLEAIKSEVDSRTENGEDPFEAWGDVLTSILIGAGIAGAAIAWIKAFDEWRKAVEKIEK